MTGTAAKRRKLSKQSADDDQVSKMPDLAAVPHIIFAANFSNITSSCTVTSALLRTDKMCCPLGMTLCCRMLLVKLPMKPIKTAPSQALSSGSHLLPMAMETAKSTSLQLHIQGISRRSIHSSTLTAAGSIQNGVCLSQWLRHTVPMASGDPPGVSLSMRLRRRRL